MSKKKAVVAEKVHAELGASSASRWMNCPGSVELSRTIPEPPTSEAAVEGTRAHALAELALRKNVDPDFYVGTQIEGGEITDEMAEDIGTFVAFCRDLKEDSTETWIEHRFDLASLKPVRPLYGTADFVAYDARTKRLTVVDLKFGRGVLVEVASNEQLRYYALGAALTLGQGREIETVRSVIVQPRAMHADGPIREEVYDFMGVLDFAGELLQAAEATIKPNAPLVPGKQCRWCRASGVCPAQKQLVQVEAQMSFDAYEEPRDVATLNDEELTKVMLIIPMLEMYAKAVRSHVTNRLARGEGFPGYKLVAKRPTRKWTNEEAILAQLKNDGYAPDEYNAPAKLKSVAQIEKLYGKAAFKDIGADLVNKVSSGFNMVPESDPRPALAALAQEEFDALLAGPPETDD